MKIAYKNEIKQRKNSDICKVTEYPTFDSDLDFAIVTVSGRYPDNNKRAVNLVCKEIVYVQNGSGKLCVNDKEYSLNAGDLVLVEAGEKFYWDGHMTLHISCHPTFTVEQHQLVN